MTREQAMVAVRKALESWDKVELVNELMLHVEACMDSRENQNCEYDWSDLVEFYRKDDIQNPG
jgi:hypothetical protein